MVTCACGDTVELADLAHHQRGCGACEHRGAVALVLDDIAYPDRLPWAPAPALEPVDRGRADSDRLS